MMFQEASHSGPPEKLSFTNNPSASNGPISTTVNSSLSPNFQPATARRRFAHAAIFPPVMVMTTASSIVQRNSIGSDRVAANEHRWNRNTAESGKSNLFMNANTTGTAASSGSPSCSPLMQVNPWNIQVLINLETQKHSILRKLEALQPPSNVDLPLTKGSSLFVPSAWFWKILRSEFPLEFDSIQQILRKAVDLCSTSFQGQEWLFVEQVFKFVAIQVTNSLQGVSGVSAFPAADASSCGSGGSRNEMLLSPLRQLHETTANLQQTTLRPYLRPKAGSEDAKGSKPMSTSLLQSVVSQNVRIRLGHMCLSRDEQWEAYSREAELYWLQRSKKREAELVQDLKDQEEEIQRLKDSHISLYINHSSIPAAAVQSSASSSIIQHSVSCRPLLIALRSIERQLRHKLMHYAIRSWHRRTHPHTPRRHHKEIITRRSTRAHTTRHSTNHGGNNPPSTPVSVVNDLCPAKQVTNNGVPPLLSARSLSPLNRERTRISPIRPTREPQMHDNKNMASDAHPEIIKQGTCPRGVDYFPIKSPISSSSGPATSTLKSLDLAAPPPPSCFRHLGPQVALACSVPSSREVGGNLASLVAVPAVAAEVNCVVKGGYDSQGVAESSSHRFSHNDNNNRSGLLEGGTGCKSSNHCLSDAAVKNNSNTDRRLPLKAGSTPLSTIARSLQMKEVKSQSVFVPTLTTPVASKQQAWQQRVLHEIQPNGSQSARCFEYHYGV